jgi:hypothetical protein
MILMRSSATRGQREDPVVSEVRRARAKLVRAAGGTVSGLLSSISPRKQADKPTGRRPRRRRAA